MIASLGTLALTLAFALALYGLVSSVLGARRGNAVLVESARTSAYSVLALVLAANALMEIAILRNDFSIAYVAENSSRVTPTFFKALTLWSADAGSLLLWNLVLAGFIAAVAFRFRRRRPETFPWAMAVLYAVALFYLALVLGPTTPFGRLASIPADGRGPLPLLQNNPLMAVHPPLLYVGFIGFTVPFAFAIAALITGRLSDEWIRITRRWTIVAWAGLTAGLLVGGLWSYTVLGWGGYWGWDPVENIALLPWLTGTAFLHSVIIQERRGMLKVWNVSLIVGTFALTTLATFLTRGSILDSVHAFAQSIVGPLYLGFVVLTLVVGFGLVVLRSDGLRTEGHLDSVLSRETVFLGNNLVLIAFTFTVLLGTIFPLIEEAVSGKQVSVGAPYFRAATLPLAMLLLFLAGLGPLLRWRMSRWSDVDRRLLVPGWAAALVLIVLVVAGVRNVAAVGALSLAAFVAVANVSELVRGFRGFRRAHGGSWGRASARAVAHNRRLYGGLVAHLGLAVVAVAITVSSSFAQVRDLSLTPGGTAAFLGYDVRLDGIRSLQQTYRRVLVADLTLSRDRVALGSLSPSLNLYPRSAQTIGTPSLRVGLLADVYASASWIDPSGGRVRLRMFLNPGTLWLWIGGAVILLGGVIAGWPLWIPRAAPAPVLPEERELEVVR